MASDIVKTLIYSDIFDYPLTSKQIHKYLLSKKAVSLKTLEKSLKGEEKVSSKNNFYFLKGRKGILERRIERERNSIIKLRKTKRILKFLYLIPSIKMIGISGSLSMLNAQKGDDIDLFIISEKGGVWSTRFFLILILRIMRRYRGRGDGDFADKFCINLIVDENSMSFSKQQNMYIAHEIAQVMPVFQRNDSYALFLKKNIWITKFMPNFKGHVVPLQKDPILLSPVWKILKNLKFELIAKVLQKSLMKKPLGGEVIGKNILAFHPYDREKSIIKEYNLRLKQY